MSLCCCKGSKTAFGTHAFVLCSHQHINKHTANTASSIINLGNNDGDDDDQDDNNNSETGMKAHTTTNEASNLVRMNNNIHP